MTEADNNDPVSRVAALAAEAAERARKNREMFPEMSKVVDMFKRAFGADQVRVTYICENGHELGKRLPEPPERTMLIRDMAFSTPKTPKPERASSKRSRKSRAS